MKKNIHPKYNYVTVTCASCGATFRIGTTLDEDFTTPICSKCHSAYTGKERSLTKVDRVAKFMERMEKAKQLQQSKGKK